MDVLALNLPDNSNTKVIVRQYGPWHIDDDPHPGTVESALLEFLGKSAVPVPELILSEEATEIIGRPTIVTSFVRGKPIVDPVDRQGWVGQLVTVISQVHALDPPRNLRSLVRSMYPRYDHQLSADEPSERFTKHPLGVELWSRLKELWPKVDKSEEKLLHGDFWPGNTLWRDDRLIALVDWEEPKLGTPSYDLAVLVQDPEYFGIEIEDIAIEAYERTTGRSLVDFRFWMMARALDAMPDTGSWADDFVALGGHEVTADEVRAGHSNSIQRLLRESY